MASIPGNILRFKTTPEGADEFASILERAVEHVNAEEGTKLWFSARSEEEPTSFFIVDLFADADGRKAHFTGEAAKLITEEGGSLLAGSPENSAVETLATKNA
jgi:quinol monooxygenase YgiN